MSYPISKKTLTKMNKNEIFFGENGLTSTSANHIANMAKEYTQNFESGKLSNFDFFETTVGLIGSPERSKIKRGTTPQELAEFPTILDCIAQANSLIAWLREAIKARDALFSAINNKDMDEWLSEYGLEVPVSPSRKKIDRDDIISELNIKERNRLYELQAKAAALGKFVHPDGHFARARKALLEVIAVPNNIKGEGRDAMIYEYTNTCEECQVNEMFFKIQGLYRSTQAELNSMNHNIDEAVRAKNMEYMAQYNEELQKYNATMKEYTAKFELWKSEESKRIADLKIVIPVHLENIYNTINDLSKRK